MQGFLFMLSRRRRFFVVLIFSASMVSCTRAGCAGKLTHKRGLYIMANRPGGLTALAVLNFVIGGIFAIVSLAALFLSGVASTAGAATDAYMKSMAEKEGGAEIAAVASQAVSQATTMLTLITILSIATTIVLIWSGVGFIKQSKKFGKNLGFVAGILLIALLVLNVVAGTVGALPVLLAVYGALLIVLPASSMKDAFVNP